ncbi:MAG: GAF domain-containing protein [Candidatus Zipacnadales bacterium]
MPASEHALETAARLITARAQPEQVLDAVLNAALETTRASRAAIALVDRRNGELVIQRVMGPGWTPEKRAERMRTGVGVHEGIIGLVATTGKPYYAADVTHDPHYHPLFEDVKSELAAPLIRSQGRIAGVLNLEASEPDAFSEEDQRMVSALAALASVAVSMAEHHRREHELAETARKLNRWGDPAELFQEFVDAAASILQAYDSSLFLRDPDGRTLTLVASHGPLREHVGSAQYEVGEGLTGSVAEHGHPIRLEDVAGDPHWVGKHQEIPQERIAGFVAVPVLTEDGRVEGVLRAIRDKTPASLPNAFDEDDESILSTLASHVAVLIERGRLFRRLVQSERLAAWGQLSARAAHLLGNKVFAMKGAVGELKYMFERAGSCSPACMQMLDLLVRSLSETDRIVQSFKDFVAARDVQWAPLDINHLLATSVERLRPSAGPVTLVTRLEATLPLVHGDLSRLTETFEELIGNAIAWQPEGGEVRVSSALVSAAEAAQLIRTESSGPYVRIDIEDDGPGIPPHAKERIFEPFYSTRGRGLGLGLAICREVIRAQGGEIVEIGESGGAHFVVFLPIDAQKGASYRV